MDFFVDQSVQNIAKKNNNCTCMPHKRTPNVDDVDDSHF